MAGEKFGREAGVLALSPRRMTVLSLFRAGLFQGEVLFRVGLFRGRFCSGWAGGRIEKSPPAVGEIIQNRNTPPIVPGSRPDCSRVVEQRKHLILADCSICSMCSIFSLWSRWKYANRGVVQEIAHIYGASRRVTPHLEQPGTARNSLLASPAFGRIFNSRGGISGKSKGPRRGAPAQHF